MAYNIILSINSCKVIFLINLDMSVEAMSSAGPSSSEVGTLPYVIHPRGKHLATVVWLHALGDHGSRGYYCSIQVHGGYAIERLTSSGFKNVELEFIDESVCFSHYPDRLEILAIHTWLLTKLKPRIPPALVSSVGSRNTVPGHPPAPPARGFHTPTSIPKAAAKKSHSSLPSLNWPKAGTFHRSPEPGKPPYAKVGDKVRKGQVVCMIELVKSMEIEEPLLRSWQKMASLSVLIVICSSFSLRSAQPKTGNNSLIGNNTSYTEG